MMGRPEVRRVVLEHFFAGLMLYGIASIYLIHNVRLLLDGLPTFIPMHSDTTVPQHDMQSDPAKPPTRSAANPPRKPDLNQSLSWDAFGQPDRSDVTQAHATGAKTATII
jgi:hypothetical protein